MSSEHQGGPPPAPRPPDDRLLQEFLDGRGEVTDTYRSRPLEAAPAQLAAQIREMARQELTQRRRRFSPARLAIAASVLLTLGLGVELGLLRAPGSPQPAPPAMVPAPRPAAPPAPLSAESQTAPAASATTLADTAGAAAGRPAPSAAAKAAPAQGSAAAIAEQKAAERQKHAIEERRQAIAANSLAENRKAEVATTTPAAPSTTPPAAPMAGLVGGLAGASVANKRSAQIADAEVVDQPSLNTLPAIQGLVPGTTTRAEVQARLGEPDSKGVAYAETDESATEALGAVSRQAAAADAAGQAESEDLNFDFYARLPGHPTPVEFYYERMSTRLVAVRLLVEPALTPEALRQQLGWAETPVIRHSAEACATAAREAAADETYPRYWHFAAHAAYWVEPEPKLISDVILRTACAASDAQH